MAEPLDNPDLASIDASLKDAVTIIGSIAEALTMIDDELILIRRAAFPQPAPRQLADWPWAPGTLAQGFLGARWNRRNGNVYGGATNAESKIVPAKRAKRLGARSAD